MALDLLKFLGKFILFYALVLYLWTLLLPTYLDWLAKAGSVVGPLTGVFSAPLRLDGQEIVAESATFSIRVGQLERVPFTSVTFLAMALATSGLSLGGRLKVIVIGLGILFCSYVLYLLAFIEYGKASAYFGSIGQAVASGSSLPTAYSRAQWQFYDWMIYFWQMVGKDVLPIILWASLTLAHSRAKDRSWARRLL